MGSKLSSPNSPSRPRSSTITGHAGTGSGLHNMSTASRGDGPVGMASMSRSHGRQVLRFDPALLQEGHSAQLGVRVARTHSAIDSGIRIPHSDFSWLYASNAHRGGHGNAGPSQVTARVPGHPAMTHSLPPYFLSSMRDSKCPMCGKMIPAEDVEVHFVMCLTKPRVTYNEDVLSTASGECAICLEDLEEGNSIARLPCLCIYHKSCIDQWFLKNQTCPEHPPD